MAAFCFDCFNKVFNKNDPENKYIISKELNLCEGCCEMKRVVIAPKKYYYKYKFRILILPFVIIWRIILLPVSLYKIKKAKECDK